MDEEAIKKLREAKTKEDILAIAKECGKELTAKQAEELLERLNSEENGISDDDLEAVAGGRECRLWYDVQPPKKFF